MEAEKLIEKKYFSLEATIIRPPIILGDMKRIQQLVPAMRKLLVHRFVPGIWRKDPKIGFIPVEDIASFVLMVGSGVKTPSSIYNLQGFEV